jgi:hypothetical protein
MSASEAPIQLWLCPDRQFEARKGTTVVILPLMSAWSLCVGQTSAKITVLASGRPITAATTRF